MHTPPPLPTPPEPQDDDNLPSELSNLTGLFNPEIIWQREAQLDSLDEQEEQPAPGPEEE